MLARGEGVCSLPESCMQDGLTCADSYTHDASTFFPENTLTNPQQGEEEGLGGAGRSVGQS